jgi:hypothetical protein
MNWRDFVDKHGFKLIVAAILIAVAMLYYTVAYAAGPSATIKWNHPTAYTDGSALALSEIKETYIAWRRPGSSTVVGSVRVAAPATSTVVTGLACGNFNFVAVTVVKTNSIESTEGGPVLYATGVQCAPNPPTNLEVS